MAKKNIRRGCQSAGALDARMRRLESLVKKLMDYVGVEFHEVTCERCDGHGAWQDGGDCADCDGAGVSFHERTEPDALSRMVVELGGGALTVRYIDNGETEDIEDEKDGEATSEP